MDGRDQIQEVKDRLDIVSVVQEYVPTLKKTGRNHFGLCPFHQEKSPSFSVNPELRLYKCFGCGEGGDVINFIQKIENLDFPRALEIAAKKAGVKIERKLSPRDKKIREEKQKLIEANTIAAKFFKYILFEHSTGEEARKYVRSRKLKRKQVEDFMLGFAPDGF
ncbi:DNA primase, partial [Candidatus Dojkabacteria bacterium]|nr:DNA primase [Candidatus Dojkabacteria bacterium]